MTMAAEQFCEIVLLWNIIDYSNHKSVLRCLSGQESHTFVPEMPKTVMFTAGRSGVRIDGRGRVVHVDTISSVLSNFMFLLAYAPIIHFLTCSYVYLACYWIDSSSN